MEDDTFVSDNLYVKRLLWQQINSPQYVVLSPSKDGAVHIDGRLEDVKMDISDCLQKNLKENTKLPTDCTSLVEDVENNNANYTIFESEKMKTDDPDKVDELEKENSYVDISKLKITCKDKVPLFVPDRFIPKRDFQDWQTRFAMITDENGDNQVVKKKDTAASENRDSQAYNYLLQNELLGTNMDGNVVKTRCEERRVDLSESPKNLFYYKRKIDSMENIETLSPYSLSPVGLKSQKLLRSSRKATRKISRIPFKVLDAPELQDDFYLNLVDWSSQNVLAVGLGNSVYLWSACTSQVTRLCDFITDSNTVTSVAWNERGNYVAVGTHHGYVQIWDVANAKMITRLMGHTARVGALAWNGETLCSGSRDRLIFQRDIRSDPNIADRRLVGHRQEVCGLKWSPDNQYLASGGNDNRLYVWNNCSVVPVQTYSEHIAAVKAIAWSPHQHGLLASGGGTADRYIRFWNTLTGQSMQSIDTGSQVCNLAWSKHSSELVSTHGYSQNQILVWKYPSLTQVAKLTGHSYRVLYLAMSPDGESIVTGAGDETLRFWSVFSKTRSQKECRGNLNLFSHIR